MGCEHAQAAGGQTAPSQFEENTLSEVKRVIAVLSGKGGVGKSFVTGAIATELARHGHKVGVLDADITGPSIPKMFGMSGRHVHALGNLMLPEISEHGVKVMSSNLLLQNETDPVLWRGPVIAGAIRQFWSETSWGPIDYLLVDSAPIAARRSRSLARASSPRSPSATTLRSWASSPSIRRSPRPAIRAKLRPRCPMACCPRPSLPSRPLPRTKPTRPK